MGHGHIICFSSGRFGNRLLLLMHADKVMKGGDKWKKEICANKSICSVFLWSGIFFRGH